MTSTKLRAAVIGCGSFGQNHLRILAQSDSVDLVAAVDQDPERASAAARQYPGCATLTDPRGLAGLDLLVEKPIAAAQSRGRILQVGHLEHFNPAAS